MIELSESIIGFFGVLLGGLFTIAGVVIGAKMSYKAERERYRKQTLVDAYTEFFSMVYLSAIQQSDDAIHKMVTAAERVKLLCSSSASSDIDLIIQKILTEKTDEAFALLQEFRLKAKNDVK